MPLTAGLVFDGRKNMKNAVLGRVIAIVGSQSELARLLNITPQAINGWRNKKIPPCRVLMIEQISGVSRHELRPDVYGVKPDFNKKQRKQGIK